MNRKELDELSAVIDSEASEAVMLRVSHRISRDAEVRETLLRYQMIGDSLRGEEISPRSADLVMAVSQRLEAEPTVLAPPPASTRNRWFQPVAGAAIAASVAAVGVMLGPQLINGQKGEGNQVPPAGIQVVAQPAADGMETAPILASSRSMRWKTLDGTEEDDRGHLNRYLEQHSQYATRNGLQSMIPYTTLVSFGGTHPEGR